MPEKKRPGTHRDYTTTPSRGVPMFVKEDPTPVPHVVEPARTRTPTPPDLEAEIAEVRAAHNRLAEETWDARHTKERFDKLDHQLDRLHTRLDGYAERVVRAEAVSDDAREAQRNTEPKLDALIRQGAETARLADACERLIERMDGHSDRLGAIEQQQAVAAERFEAHDERDQQIAASVSSIDRRVGALEQQRAVTEATGKIQKSTTLRLWLPVTKGIGAVLLAVAAAIGVVYAAGGGCT